MPIPTTESAGARSFRSSPAARAVDLVGVAFFLAVAALPLLLGRPLSGRWSLDALGMAAAALLALACVRAFVSMGALYVLHEGGIVRRVRGGARMVRWQQVAEVRAEAGRLRRLDLLDERGELLLSLPYDLVGFEELQGIVLARTEPFRRVVRRDELEVGVQLPGAPLVAAALIAGGGWLAWRNGQPTAWMLPLAGAGLAALWALAFRRLRVSGDGVRLWAPLRRREIAWREVAAVRLQEIPRRQAVVLERRDGGRLVLRTTAGQAVPVYERLEAGLRDSRGEAPAAAEGALAACRAETQS